jgi:hypothetical protein
MSLLPTISGPADLFEKLMREAERTIGGIDNTARADHFYNFCITALSLRDHMWEHVNAVEENTKDKYRNKWGMTDEVQAAYDIANTLKHFTLRHRGSNTRRIANTRNVVTEQSNLSYHYVDRPPDRYKVDSFIIQLKTGESFEMWDFFEAVSQYWESVFAKEGIELSKKCSDYLRKGY